MRPLRIPAESRLLLWLAAALVPAPRRREWRMEWEGEIWWWMAAQPEAARSARERAALAAHCAGALKDGACLWLEQGGRRPDWRGPRACLAAGLALLAVLAVSSGGFGDTRRSLQAMFRPRNTGLAIPRTLAGLEAAADLEIRPTAAACGDFLTGPRARRAKKHHATARTAVATTAVATACGRAPGPR